MDYLAFAVDTARSTFQPPRDTHPCGRCSRPAAFLDRSGAGVSWFVCYACHPKGHPTLVAERSAGLPVKGEACRA